ncbi:MAG: type II secretion system F family protein [Bacillota bacterium]
MVEYNYKYYNDIGDVVEGVIDADAREDAVARLSSQDIQPFSVELRKEAGSENISSSSSMNLRSKRSNIILFTRQLANLLLAGVQLSQALLIIERILNKGSFKDTVHDIHESLKSGRSFAETLAKYPSYFSDTYVSMIRAGEESGFLGLTCKRLAANLEEEDELKSFVTSSLLYPAILLLVSIVAIVIMLVFVLPRFVTIYESYNQALPYLTQVLLNVAGFLTTYGWFILGAIGSGIVGLWFYYQTEQGKETFHRFFLKVPLIGSLVSEIETYRICVSLGTMLDSGVPLLKALRIVEQIAGNIYFRRAVATVWSKVRRGTHLSESMRNTVFPDMAIYMVGVGEQTGELSDMLIDISDQYEKEYKNRLNRVMRLFEPFIILFMGVSIGLIVIAILLPILGISNIQL